MIKPETLSDIEGMDIYLLDQIMKGRYTPNELILDAGAGNGRNLNWFLRSGFNVTACDENQQCAELIRARYPNSPVSFQACNVAEMPYSDGYADHVICNAVLHFAENESHFITMFKELLRVTKPGGSVFIRACSDIGIEDKIRSIGNGHYHLPDGSDRFLMTRSMIDELSSALPIQFLEPVKSVNVADLRVMTTLVLSKSS